MQANLSPMQIQAMLQEILLTPANQERSNYAEVGQNAGGCNGNCTGECAGLG